MIDKSKIVIAQFYTENLKYGKYAEEINRKYCEEKGYTYIVEKNTEKIISEIEGRAFTWYKPKFILEVLEQLNPEYVLFLDIDAIVSDTNQQIEDFIDETYNIIFAQDNGPSAMNAGVFLLKNTEWSKNFLKRWWESGDIFTPENSRNLPILEENFGKKGYFKHALWHDQTCLTILYEHDQDVKNNIKVISSRSFNHMKYNEGNFIFHAFCYGTAPNRTLDMIHKQIFSPVVITKNINLIVYHIYCVGNYLEVVAQQLNRLKISGLYDWCDTLEITCINVDNDFTDVQALIKGLDKVNLTMTTNNWYEYEGIKKVWEYSQTYNGKVLYFHTKGVSNTYNNLQERKESLRKKKGVGWWKEAMEYFVIDNYKECIQKLNEHDQCGLTMDGTCGWWWGNFWWSNLSWIRINEKPENSSRWYFEAWLNNHRKPSIHEFYHFEFNPYYTELPSDIYFNPDAYTNSIIEVTNAFYGTLDEQQDEGRPIVERKVVDVTDKIKQNLILNHNRGFNIMVDNNIGGDPYYGVRKVLEIYFTIDGKEYILVADENRNLRFQI